MKKNILVTGGAGYIGSHILEILLKKKYSIYVVDNLSTGYKKLINKKIKFYKIDIRNTKKIKEIIKNNNIYSVIHLAACLSVGEGEKKPKKYYSNNVIGTRNLLNACTGLKVKNFLFSSTCAVYKDKITKVHENTKLLPKSVYGKTKLDGEKIIKTYCKINKINYGILRFFNVAGASLSGNVGQIKSGDQLFKNLTLSILKKKPKINIYGNNYNTVDGTCVRDYIHVSDIANIHLKVLNKIDKIKKSIILNCGYGFGISVLQVIKTFQKISKKKIKIVIQKKRSGDMEKIISINTKLKKFINWNPRYNSLKKIATSALNWEIKYRKINFKKKKLF
ncbi:MAG: UDP-glucose 4-epimerase [Pelagibacterales bacterium]|nr:UDP-glucose 4-epimerase [Pelagibacterales bacterium]